MNKHDGGVCRFANRKAMNVLAPRGSNYNKGIAPVTGGKLQVTFAVPGVMKSPTI